MSRILAAVFLLIVAFFAGYGVRSAVSRWRKRRWMDRRSTKRLRKVVVATADHRILIEAINIFANAREKGEMSPLFGFLGQACALVALGRDAEAEAAILQALELKPEDVDEQETDGVRRPASWLERRYAETLRKSNLVRHLGRKAEGAHRETHGYSRMDPPLVREDMVKPRVHSREQSPQSEERQEPPSKEDEKSR